MHGATVPLLLFSSIVTSDIVYLPPVFSPRSDLGDGSCAGNHQDTLVAVFGNVHFYLDEGH